MASSQLHASLPEELRQIVGGAVHRPFGLYILNATQKKAPKASRLFELPEYRLHRCFSASVDFAAFLAFKLSADALA